MLIFQNFGVNFKNCGVILLNFGVNFQNCGVNLLKFGVNFQNCDCRGLVHLFYYRCPQMWSEDCRHFTSEKNKQHLRDTIFFS
ncbi:hypothetical protein Hanom_Chr07g00607421 [Helianthus anomalus]